MSYTNEDLVRRHLADTRPLSERVTDQTVVLGESDYVRFFNGPVDADSVVVKAQRGSGIVRRSITLSAGAAVLGTAPVVPGSVVVASDSSLGTIYAENVDFVVDYVNAVLHTKEGGALGADAAVTTWLREYTLCVEGVDFALKAATGEIKRLAGGSIAPAEIVALDYTPLYTATDETLLAAAVTEANGLIGAEVDPDRSFGADPVLQAAATYHALSIVCRASAARVLGVHPEQDKAAATWIKLSEFYVDRADRLLAKFHPPFVGPAAPSAT